MRVLVTGGAGYIGSHIAWALHDRGDSVAVIDDLSTGDRGLLPPAVSLNVCDAGDFSQVSGILRERRIDWVIHAAGSIVVSDSVGDPLSYYGNNTGVSRRLVSACLDAGVQGLLFSSTAAVYGEPDRVPISEDAPLSPINPYGRSKLMTEWMLQDVAAAHGLKALCLRYFNAAGADPRGRTGQISPVATHLIKIAAQAATGQRRGLAVFGTDYATRDGTCERDFIHVSDLAQAHLDGLDYLAGEAPRFSALNLGYGRGATVRDVIEALQSLLSSPIAVQDAPRRPGDPARLIADPARARALLGWQPQRDDLSAILRDAVAWEAKLAGIPSPLRAGV